MQPDDARALLQRAIAEIETVIVVKRSVIENALVALLANGHLLIEDVPGTGKTMLARSLARCIDGVFRRIDLRVLDLLVHGFQLARERHRVLDRHTAVQAQDEGAATLGGRGLHAHAKARSREHCAAQAAGRRAQTS